MPLRFRHQLPTGETRAWTLREIVQGAPVDRPSHPMLIHFPIAFYVGALGFDLLSRVRHFPAGPISGTYLIIGALAGFALAATTGLADRASMRPESKIKGLATRHMWLQVIAAAFFALTLVLRWPERHHVRASLVWIALEIVGILVMMVAADIGGQMVYKIGFRVSTGPGSE